ncbi:MAG TPA: hypothetical protein PK770_06535, partial [Kiritimatiellia bacterium]|nr:hypothetical protein [Kiritimatiellia bacterium]
MMKKLVTALAACVMASAVFAQLTSQIVGYNTVTVYPGYNLLAVNFDGVGAGSLTLAELFPTTDGEGNLLPGFTAGSGASTGDNILFYDASTEGYITYYLYKGAKTSDTKNYKWVTTAGVVASDTPVASGSAFWYKKMAATTNAVTFAGQVANDASETHQILTGYNMFSSIYPAAWNPNDLGVAYWQTCGAMAGNAGTGDNIRLYDATTEGYTAYYLYKGAKTSDTKNYKWVSADGNVVAMDTPVSTGSAFWYKKIAATTNEAI